MSNSTYDDKERQRIAIAARIAAGLAANPSTWEGPSPEATIAHKAWQIAGAIQRIAETGGA
jgi:hypothetical protein